MNKITIELSNNKQYVVTHYFQRTFVYKQSPSPDPENYISIEQEYKLIDDKSIETFEPNKDELKMIKFIENSLHLNHRDR